MENIRSELKTKSNCKNMPDKGYSLIVTSAFYSTLGPLATPRRTCALFVLYLHGYQRYPARAEPSCQLHQLRRWPSVKCMPPNVYKPFVKGTAVQENELSEVADFVANEFEACHNSCNLCSDLFAEVNVNT